MFLYAGKISKIRFHCTYQFYLSRKVWHHLVCVCVLIVLVLNNHDFSPAGSPPPAAVLTRPHTLIPLWSGLVMATAFIFIHLHLICYISLMWSLIDDHCFMCLQFHVECYYSDFVFSAICSVKLSFRNRVKLVWNIIEILILSLYYYVDLLCF